MSFAAQDRIIKEIKRQRGWREVNEVAKAPTKFNCDPFGEHMFNVTLVGQFLSPPESSLDCRVDFVLLVKANQSNPISACEIRTQ